METYVAHVDIYDLSTMNLMQTTLICGFYITCDT